MSNDGNHLYEFGDFSFDAEGKVLRRSGKPVPLTPKTLELLQVLIKNHGRIVEKEELMSELWADSFVEDSNLTFTVRQLRKFLADSAREPTYIETVPRRGYRFIAEVRETTDDNFSKDDDKQAFSQPIERNSAALPGLAKFLVPAAVLLISVIATGFWYESSKTGKTYAPVLSAPFSSEKLSTNGQVSYAVVSPDGKNMVYTNGIRGKQSIWLRQLESANNVEIIPSSGDLYGGLAFSPDGNFLYFARNPKTFGQFDVYRVSIFGGVPTKLVNETQGWISISPDGAKISFVRCFQQEEENCSLWIADSLDGKNEKKLVSRPRPVRIADNLISPDGKSIAFAVGQSENQANEFALMEVDIESGAERKLTAEKFFNIKSLVYLPDGGGWLITARKNTEKNFRIWQVSATGDAQPLTKDSETYSALSLDKDASVIVSTQVKAEFRSSLFQTKNPFDNRILADATGVAFAPGGNIIISSSMAGNSDIWSIDADGRGQRQLTNDAADESSPVVSFDNNSIFFHSIRTGEGHVWRMNADGSNQVQITKTEGGYPLFVSPDGKWLYYLSGRQRTLWRVSTDSGQEQSIFNKRNHHFAFSPDGSGIAFAEKQGEENVLIIVSLADGQMVKTFKPAEGKAKLVELEWSHDGKFLAYILVKSEFENNILWFQPIDGEMPHRIADLGNEKIFEMSGFALSPDGKSFAVAQGGWKHDAVLLKGLK